MFNKSLKAISIEAGKLSGAEISLARTPKLKKLYEVENSSKNFELAFKKMLATLHAKQIYLVLDESYFYSLEISIPLHIQKSQKRSYIKDKVLEQIPDQLIEGHWDYFSLNSDGDEEQINVFSLVNNKYKFLKTYLDDIGVKALLIYPLSFLNKYHENYFLSLAIIYKNNQNSDDNTLKIPGQLEIATKTKSWFDIIFAK